MRPSKGLLAAREAAAHAAQHDGGRSPAGALQRGATARRARASGVGARTCRRPRVHTGKPLYLISRLRCPCRVRPRRRGLGGERASIKTLSARRPSHACAYAAGCGEGLPRTAPPQPKPPRSQCGTLPHAHTQAPCHTTLFVRSARLRATHGRFVPRGARGCTLFGHLLLCSPRLAPCGRVADMPLPAVLFPSRT